MSHDEMLKAKGLCVRCSDNHAAPSSLYCLPCQEEMQRVADEFVAYVSGEEASPSSAETSR